MQCLLINVNWSASLKGIVCVLIRYDVVLCVVLDVQQEVDGLIEQEKGQSRSVIIDCGLQYSTCHDHYSLGTTKKGIGPTYSAKVGCTITDTLNEPRLFFAGR